MRGRGFLHPCMACAMSYDFSLLPLLLLLLPMMDVFDPFRSSLSSSFFPLLDQLLFPKSNASAGKPSFSPPPSQKLLFSWKHSSRNLLTAPYAISYPTLRIVGLFPRDYDPCPNSRDGWMDGIRGVWKG